MERKVQAKGAQVKSNSAQDITCYNCGKKEHRAADCWSKKRPDGKGDKWLGSGKGDRSGKGGKGNKGKGGKGGKGKVAGSMEEMDDPGDGNEPAPEAEVGIEPSRMAGRTEWLSVKATGLFSRLHQENWCPVRALEPLKGSMRAAINAV